MGFFARQTLEIHHRHAQAVAVVAANGGHDIANGCAAPFAISHRQILAVDLALSNHEDQSIHGTTRARHDHQAAGVFVQAVHNARAGQHHRLRVHRQEAVQQGAAPIAGSWVNHQARGFEQHAQVRVLVDHIEWDVFRLESLTLRRRSQNQLVCLAQPDFG